MPSCGFRIGQSQPLERGIVFFRPRDVYHMQALHIHQPMLESRDGLVDMACPEASAEHEQHRSIIGDAKHRTPLFARGRKHRAAHRVARDNHLAGNVDPFRRDTVSQCDCTRTFRQKLVSHAHDGILLMHHHGHTQLFGRHAHGNGHISAKPHHGGGTELAHPGTSARRGTSDFHA